MARTSENPKTHGPKDRSPAMTPAPVRVSVGSTVHEVKGVRPRTLNEIVKTVKRGALKAHRTGGAEVTLRFVNGAVLISELRPAPAESAQPATTALEVVTARSPEAEGALERARERGRHRVAEILERPEMLNAETLGAHIGLSRVAVNDRLQKYEVLGLEGAKRGIKCPEWQIGEDGKPFDALPALFERLGDSPWAVYRFLVQHHSELEGRTAIEALQQGDAPTVLDAAEGVARGTFA